jgi:hypothetical protein
MPHGIARAIEKFHVGIRILATHPGKVQERLIAAFVPHISSIDPTADIPDEELREEFIALMERVTKRGPLSDSKGSIHHTIGRMYAKIAVPIAEEVLYLARLAEQFQEYEREQRRKNKDGDRTPAPS